MENYRTSLVLSHSRGFSLMQVIIAMSLLSMISLYVVQLNNNLSFITKRSDATMDQTLLMNNVHQLLSVPELCVASLSSSPDVPAGDNEISGLILSNKGGEWLINEFSFICSICKI